MQAALGGESLGEFERGLEIVPVLDQVRAERAHRGILLAAVAMRDYDRHVHPRARPGVCDTLAVIAARRRDQARGRTRRAREAVDIDDSAAQLERAHGAVVFVLDPDFGAGARTEQRPADLRRWSDRRADDLRRGDKFVAPRQNHAKTMLRACYFRRFIETPCGSWSPMRSPHRIGRAHDPALRPWPRAAAPAPRPARFRSRACESA